jgi:hypothetical protein
MVPAATVEEDMPGGGGLQPRLPHHDQGPRVAVENRSHKYVDGKNFTLKIRPRIFISG